MTVHTKQFPRRTATLEIIEEPERIVLKLRMSKYGGWDKFKDEALFKEWLLGLLVHYDSDPRPQVMENPNTGESAWIDEKNGTPFAIIRPPLDS